MNNLRVLIISIGMLFLAGSIQACYSKRATIENKHIVQLKKLFLLIHEYAESHQGIAPKSLADLKGFVDADDLTRLIYCSDEYGSRKGWIYFGEARLNESPAKILIEGPIRYNSGKKVYLNTDGHVFLK